MSGYLSWLERLRIPAVVSRRANGGITVRYATMGRVEIDEAACTGCRLCVGACPVRSLELTGEKTARMACDDSPCIACGDCVAACKPRAVRLSRPMTYEGLYRHIGRGALEFPRRF